ncbi:methyltransferase [Nitrospira sp.]|nr:methyltransferase [Nitrospira sp.]
MDSVISLEETVLRTLSDNDEMYAWDKRVPDWYWYAGQSAIRAVERCLHAVNMPHSAVRRILDLPCGHGRVLRYLKAAFPHATLTACDLVKDGVDFCCATFGAMPIYSHEDARRIPLEREAFDLIWVGSLLTHLSADRWSGLFDYFTASLRQGGVLVFTTGGRHVYRQIKGLEEPYEYYLPYWRKTVALYDFEQTGFGYGDYWQTHYGISIADPSWVFAKLAQHPELRPAYFQERGWCETQDVYACVRSACPRTCAVATPASLYLKHRLREILKPRME